MMENERLNIEEAFLACLLLKPELSEKIIIDEAYFFDSKNKKAMQIFKKQYEEFKIVSIAGIEDNYKSFFQNQKELEEFINYLSILMCVDCLPSQFNYYQETLIKRYSNRKIMEEIFKFQKNQITQEELLESIHKYEQESIKTDSINLNANEIYDLISKQNKKINFNFSKLCKYADIQEHDLVIIAARPGIGKTGFALNLLENLSETYNCVLFNMEMTEQQVYRRLVAINSNVPMFFHDKPETDYQKKAILNGCNNISKKKIQVITSGQTIRSIRSKIIKESSKEHTIFFIDYVGLIKDTIKNRSSYERVTEIVKELRQISLDYECTIFCLAQINRSSEKERDKRPRISDLKESGELEQSATAVIMLHDEGYYKGSNQEIEDIDVIIGKNRNGQTGFIQFEYNKKNQKFSEKRSY